MTWRRYHDSVEDDSAGEATEEATAGSESVADGALIEGPPRLEGASAEGGSLSQDGTQGAQGPSEQLLAKRVRVPLAFFTIIMLVIIARLALWQLPIDDKAGSVPVAEAAEPSRGRIVDRNGLLMATDDFVYDVYARPSEIHTADVGQSIMISLTKILDEPSEIIDQALAPEKDLVILSREATGDQCQADPEPAPGARDGLVRDEAHAGLSTRINCRPPAGVYQLQTPGDLRPRSQL